MNCIGNHQGGAWSNPPCQEPGCRNSADTFGAISGGRMGNICAYHASRQSNKRVRRQKRKARW